ncbi:ABC transporter permease [Cloacibacterium sp. Arc13]|uniref:phosphatase PAP2 family protein n=1 Tax=unclassified Cloacibacterium TaxID=2620870 RepID=UPI00352F67B7
MSKKNFSAIIFLSKVISNLLNPLFSLLIFFVCFAYVKMTWEESLINILLMIALVVIPIFSWISWNVKKGNYTNMDVSDRKQRNSLYLFNFIVIAIYTGVLYFTKQRTDLLFIIVFLFFLMLIMHISNFFIKSSMHTAFNVFVTALFFSLNPILGIIWFVLTSFVAISRIILKRHTPKEVIMGALIGTIVSLAYLYFSIQTFL